MSERKTTPTCAQRARNQLGAAVRNGSPPEVVAAYRAAMAHANYRAQVQRIAAAGERLGISPAARDAIAMALANLPGDEK